MINKMVSLFSRALMPTNVQKSTAVRKVSSTNPFSNPFVASQGTTNYASYAKNNPVRGGYFAGYYNGKQNIVGQRLFIEA